MVDGHRDLGRRGERVACNHLQKKGFRILAQNYDCPLGELDLVAKDRDVLVFIEVKSSRVPNCHPEDGVDHAKRRKLVALGQYFVAQHKLQSWICRFDVVAVMFDQTMSTQVTHYEDVFSPYDI